MLIHLVAAARPNFMKIAPLFHALKEERWAHPIIIHTGQHYDLNMSDAFFEDLGLPDPDIHLDIGSGTHAEQTGQVMIAYEKVLREARPDLVIVVGDVNSTFAATLAAVKLGIKVGHLEAGLRSFDRSMPEEVNRVLTDAICDFLFTTEESANENLRREGIPAEKIHFVGNVMIDTLLQHRETSRRSRILYQLGLLNNNSKTPKNSLVKPYAVLTLHRPSNVDNKDIFSNILDALQTISEQVPIVFPCHPRTRNRITEFQLEEYFSEFSASGSRQGLSANSIHCIEPLRYLDFLALMSNSTLVLTDSGGLQEETTVLGIPCVTLRNNTERPVTVTEGTNVVAGTKREDIVRRAIAKLNEKPAPRVPPLWDGKAAQRIIDILMMIPMD
jgi:UDP-N-acetylglucosamine 2-epimerase (non-hydrolysing)